MLIWSHHLQVALDRCMKGGLDQLNFSAAFHRLSYRCLLYKLRSTGVGEQFLFIVFEFLSDRRRRVCLEGKVSASVNVVSAVAHGSVLGPLLFTFYTSELFHIVRSHIVGYADNTTFYAIIPRPILCPQVMESLNQDLAAINSWCLKWHVRRNSKKTKSKAVSLSRAIALVYGYLIVGGTELNKLKDSWANLGR